MSGSSLRALGACVALVLVLSTALGATGAPTLVADLSESLRPRSSNPGAIYRLGEHVVFAASDPAFGWELRALHLDSFRIELLVDATPGTGDSDVHFVGELAGRLFYSSGPVDRSVLYLTDGTRAGTREVVDSSGAQIVWQSPDPKTFGARLILGGLDATTGRPGLWSVDREGRAERLWLDRSEGLLHASIAGLATTDSLLFFRELSEDDVTTNVWASDGTRAGTRRVTSLALFPDYPVMATADRFLFSGRVLDEAGTRSYLYSTDGTDAGTVALGEWGENAGEGSPRLLGANRDRAYFETSMSPGSPGLWMTDGTAAGTRQIPRPADASPIGESGIPVVWFDDEFIFWAGSWTDGGGFPEFSADYWSHDGSESPPKRLRTGALAEHPWLPPLVPLGNRLLFISLDASGQRQEIWSRSRGSAEVEQLSELCPTFCADFESISGVELGESVLYELVIRSSIFGSSWIVARSDGTVEGTRMLFRNGTAQTNIAPGYSGGAAEVEGGYVVYGWNGSTGGEPWFLDEITGDLRLMQNLEPENGPSSPSRLLSSGAELYFFTPELEGVQGPWRLRQGGSPETLSPPPCYASFAFEPRGQVGGRVLFESESGCLVSFDPATSTWEVLLENLGFGEASETLVAGQGVAYFLRAGAELWRTDGTAVGTQIVATPSIGNFLAIVGATPSHVFLQSWWYDQRLFSVRIADGVAEPLAELSPFDLWRSAEEARALDSRFFFTSRTTPEVETLWTSTGPAAETFALWRSATNERVLDLYEFGGDLFFVVAGESAALWRSDGTATGTRLVADLGRLSANADDTRARPGVVLDGRLYFVSENAASGAELWSSDGTAAGTLLHDLVPGVVGSEPRELTAVDGKLFFSAADPAFGREIWSFDPATRRALPAGDIADGALSSVPEELTAVGRTLFFAADDGIHGRELWKLDTAAPPAPCVPSSGRLCLLGGRFEFEAFWRDFRDRSGRAAGTALTDGSAYLSFFDGSGPEVMVKLVEVCAPSGRAETWIYAAGLTNLEVTLAMRESRTDERLEWRNELGRLFEPRVAAIAGGDCGPQGSTAVEADEPGETSLPLLGGRFAAEVDWVTATGEWRSATAVPMDDRSGYFWFWRDLYPEVLVRMVDACGAPGFDNFWLLAGGLTDVEVHLTVTDSWSGEVVHHESRRGSLFAPMLETAAFRVCAATP